MDEINWKVIDETIRIAENFYGTAEDPNQIPIKRESYYKFQKLSPKTILYTLNGNGDPISWTMVLPTSKALMERFLEGAISERELLDLSQPAEKYEAIYLCSAFTIPEYRNKGHAMELLRESINAIPKVDDVEYFAWPITEEGRRMTKKLNVVLEKNISIKS
jgi:hypothetical protein